MKKMTLLAALAIAGIGNANALTISGGSFSNPEQTTEINQTGNLNLFDSSLGVLTSVTFTFSGAMTTDFTLTNNAANQQTVSATGNVSLFAGSSNAAINSLINTIALALSAGTGSVTIASGATNFYGPYSDSKFTSVIFTSGLGAFQANGGGLFDVKGTSLSGLNLLGGGGNVLSEQRTTAGVGASVSYEYAERSITVPEPMTLGLLGLGLAAMGATRRRQA